MSRSLAISVAAAAVLLSPAAALAGDCMEHPLQVFEVEISSCEPLDEKNIKKVSSWLASEDGESKYAPAKNAPATLATKHAGTLVLEGTLLRSTRIHDDAYDRKPGDVPRVDKWTKHAKPAAYLFAASPATKAAGATCDAFTKGAVVMLSRPTDCSCDTGPLNGTWCWLDGYRPVGDIDTRSRALLEK